LIRLLVLTHNTKVSGAELALARILELLSRERFDVHVALPDQGPLYHRLRSMDGVTVHLVSASPALMSLKKRGGVRQIGPWLAAPGRLLSVVLRLRALMASGRFDIVLCSSIKADLYGAGAARLAGCPCVWYVHDYVDEHYFPAWLRTLVGVVGRFLPVRVLANSLASCEALARLHIPRERLYVAYYPAPVAQPAGTASDIRRELGLSSDARLVTLVGRLTPSKGQLEFAEAAARLVDRFPNARFLLVGDSLFGGVDEAYKSQLLQRL
jgi:glycosyltransferase involved in cell wall biosynthesis